MRVLVTGASGFIGRVAVKRLVERGHEITVLQRGAWPDVSVSGPVQAIEADVRTKEARQAAGRADAILHLAGQGNVEAAWRAPDEYLSVHVGGTLNILSGAIHGGGRLVLASTQRLYRPSRRPLTETRVPHPADPYAMAKLAAEQYCRLYAETRGAACSAARLFSVYGPGQVGQGSSGVVAIFRERALAGAALRVDSGPRRDLTYVDDAVSGLALALERRTPGFRVYNVASGHGTRLVELAEAVVAGLKSSSTVIPPEEDWAGGDLVADIRRARNELGYEPRVSLEQGLARLGRMAEDKYRSG